MYRTLLYSIIQKRISMKFPIFVFMLVIGFTTSMQSQDDKSTKSTKPRKKNARSIEDIKSNPEEYTSINLSRKRLTSFPTEILQCVYIEEITLSNNEITIIPQEISNLTKLR